MKINTLHLTNFRNYEKAIIHFTKNTTILVGGNAQGKTSVLEAICFLAFTKSHRTTKDVYVIKNNAPFAKIQATVDLNVDKGQFDVVISKQGKCCYSSGSVKIEYFRKKRFCPSFSTNFNRICKCSFIL